MPVLLPRIAAEAGIPAHIVPHQLRHTYATMLLRAGIVLPGLMKLLGHRKANMTLRYVEITQHDLQREFHQAQARPRYLAPSPRPPSVPTPRRSTLPLFRSVCPARFGSWSCFVSPAPTKRIYNSLCDGSLASAPAL